MDFTPVERDFFDKWSLPIRFGPACGECAHLLKAGDLKHEGWTCKAFPGGIPKDVLEGKTPHEKHLPGDNGYKYQPARIVEDRNCDWVYGWDGVGVAVRDKRKVK
jgi:hypothetical protein